MLRKLLFALCTVFIIQACAIHKPAFSGAAFESHADPSKAGIDTDKLDELTQYIKENAPTTGLVALYDGKVMYEYGDVKKVSYIASCRKSVLSMLYGKYVDNGTIDLNQTIGSLGIDEKDSLLPIEKKATVDHIITSRSGVFHEASNGGYDKANFLERGSVEPGSYFVYNNWDFNVGGHLFEQFSGRSIYEEIEDQLAKPLGFQDWNIKNQRKGGDKKKSQYQAYHIYVSTRDMAKIGQLMLNEGEWKGQQLISKDWVRKTTHMVTPYEVLEKRFGTPPESMPKMSYGYMWWLIEAFKDNPIYEGAYTASGYGGQFITIIPKANMVIAHKTVLNIPTMLGISYKSTPDWAYYAMVDKLVQARNKE